MENDIGAFMRGLPSVEQDRLTRLMQGFTTKTALGAIEMLEVELTAVKEALTAINMERDKKRREMEEAEALALRLDGEVKRKPQSIELRLLRILLGQRIAKLEDEIGRSRPDNELSRKAALRAAINEAKQIAQIVAIAGGLGRG